MSEHGGLRATAIIPHHQLPKIALLDTFIAHVAPNPALQWQWSIIILIIIRTRCHRRCLAFRHGDVFVLLASAQATLMLLLLLHAEVDFVQSTNCGSGGAAFRFVGLLLGYIVEWGDGWRCLLVPIGIRGCVSG